MIFDAALSNVTYRVSLHDPRAELEGVFNSNTPPGPARIKIRKTWFYNFVATTQYSERVKNAYYSSKFEHIPCIIIFIKKK